jgi:hypothetical protein
MRVKAFGLSEVVTVVISGDLPALTSAALNASPALARVMDGLNTGKGAGRSVGYDLEPPATTYDWREARLAAL